MYQNTQNGKKSNFWKFTSIIVLTFFIFNTMFGKMPVGALEARTGQVRLKESFVENAVNNENGGIHIPGRLGEKVDIYEGATGKKIVHIQDAHSNYYAQKKIYELLDYLSKEYGISVLNLEGGMGDYDITPFTSIRDEGIRNDVAEHFVKTGELSGAELFAIKNPQEVVLWGVEDKELYMRNIESFREALSIREEAEDFFADLSGTVEALKEKVFCDDLERLERSLSSYKENPAKLQDHLELLFSYAEERGAEPEGYKNIHSLYQLSGKEEDIDFEKAERQRDELVDRCEEDFSPNELSTLIEKSIKIKGDKSLEADFYDYLFTMSAYYGVDPGSFSHLADYAEYLKLFRSIDMRFIDRELLFLERKVREDLYEDDLQKELDKVSFDLFLTEELINFRLSRSGYGHYLEDEERFLSERYARFLHENFGENAVTGLFSGRSRMFDEYLSRVSSFYEYAFQRDEAFLANMIFNDDALNLGSLSAETEREKDIVVLITGGFHEDNLCGKMRERDISYVSVVPNFSVEKDYSSPYFELLSGGSASPISQSLQTVLSKVSSLAFASKLTSLGNEVWGDQKIERFRTSIRLYEQMQRRKAEQGADKVQFELIWSRENALAVTDERGNPIVFSLPLESEDLGAARVVQDKITVGELLSLNAERDLSSRTMPSGDKTPPVASWFKSKTWVQNAWWVETLKAVGWGMTAGAYTISHGYPFFAPFVALITGGLVFWLPHLLFNREVAFEGAVGRIAVRTGMVPALGLLPFSVVPEEPLVLAMGTLAAIFLGLRAMKKHRDLNVQYDPGFSGTTPPENKKPQKQRMPEPERRPAYEDYLYQAESSIRFRDSRPQNPVDFDRLRRRKRLRRWRDLLRLEEDPAKISDKNARLREFAVIADPHGAFDQLEKLISELKKSGVRHFVFLGDLMDRGLKSIEVVEKVKELKEEGRAVVIAGNHDLYFMQAMLGDHDAFISWVANGGYQVLRQRDIDLGDLDNLISKAKRENRNPVLHIMENMTFFPQDRIELLARVQADEKLQQVYGWMRENMDLFHLNRLGILFIHAGLPSDLEGNVSLEYQDKQGIEALVAMQTDLKNAETKDEEIFKALRSELSPTYIKTGWTARIISRGVADRVLDQMGLNGVVFGHTPLRKIFEVDGKIFGIDLRLSRDSGREGARGGSLVFGRDGIILYEGQEDESIEKKTVVNRRALIERLEKDIARLETDLPGKDVLRFHLSKLHAKKENVQLDRSLRLIAASIKNEPGLLSEERPLSQEEKRDILQRLGEAEGAKAPVIMRKAGKESVYGYVLDSMWDSAIEHARGESKRKEQAGFGIEMRGQYSASEEEVERRRIDLQRQIDRGLTPEGFSEVSFTIGGIETRFIVNETLLELLRERGRSIQEFIDSAISVREKYGEESFRHIPAGRTFIVDILNKSPNLGGDSLENGYIYMNSNASLEMMEVVLSHELMHESGISAAHEERLATQDIKVMRAIGIDPMTELNRLLSKAAGTPEFHRARAEVEKGTEETLSDTVKMSNAISVSSDINERVENWIITPTPSDLPWAENEKAHVASMVSGIFRHKGHTNIRGYRYDSRLSEEDFRTNLTETLKATLRNILRSLEKDPSADARAICFVPEERYEVAEDAVAALWETFGDSVRRITLIKKSGISSSGLVNELHHADMGRGLLNYLRIMDRIEKIRAEEGRALHRQRAGDVAERILRHIRSVVLDPGSSQLDGDPQQVLERILRAEISIPRMERMDFRRWRETHEALHEIRTSL